MIVRLFRLALWLASGLALAGFAQACLQGLTAPHPLDATERGLLDLTRRLAAHAPLYTAPAALDAPALMPGFPLAAAVLVDAFGPNLLWLRLVSLAAILGLVAGTMTIVHEETDHRTLAVASAGLLLAGYRLLAGEPAGARPEPLMLVLALGGALALRSVPGAAGALIAAPMFTAACFTHLQAAWLAAAAFVYLTRENRGRLVPFTLGMGLFLGGGYLALSHYLGPWFNYQAWDLPLSTLRFDGPGMARFAGERLLGTLGVLTVMIVFSFALPTRPWLGPSGLWSCLGLAALAAGLLATQSVSPEPQALAICALALAMVGPIAMHRVSQHLSAWPDSSRLAGEGAVLVALVLQFLAMFTLVPHGLRWPGA
jgi:hypothetical protein